MVRLADIIRSRQAEILSLWADEAGKSAAARGLQGPELRNLITKYLPALADAGDRLGTYGGEPREMVEGHLSSRLRQGFKLSEIVDELNLLGRCIASMWAGAGPQQRPGDDEVQRLYKELHLAGAAVAEMFTRHMLDDEQVDKRYRRLLQTIAVEALQPGAPPLKERLTEVLQLIMEATETQTAALLLYEPEARELRAVAAAGAADEALERYVTSIGPASFAGQVATHERTVAIRDASTTELEISDALRESGIHSLLGIRLPMYHALVGVMYVGLTEQRAFSPREVWRLEYLAEQITVHLENAKLYADLREQLSALRSERELRERFVSVLAHDLRGPLSAARLNAELLVSDPRSHDVHRELGAKVARNIDRTDRMIRDLLDANRIRAGERLQLRISEFDLGGMAREVAEELTASHGKRFSVLAESGVVGFWSHDDLRRAVWNLAINAVKYGAADAPITITVRRIHGRACLSVHNQGSIAPADQQYLFDPFSRTPSAQAGLQRGWGLGLTLVRGCAESHGGSATLSSNADAGTTFTIDLPLDARPFQNARAAAAAPA